MIDGQAFTFLHRFYTSLCPLYTVLIGLFLSCDMSSFNLTRLNATGEKVMSLTYGLAGLLALGLLIYLIYVLIKPEAF